MGFFSGFMASRSTHWLTNCNIKRQLTIKFQCEELVIIMAKDEQKLYWVINQTSAELFVISKEKILHLHLVSKKWVYLCEWQIKVFYLLCNSLDILNLSFAFIWCSLCKNKIHKKPFTINIVTKRTRTIYEIDVNVISFKILVNKYPFSIVEKS